MPLPGNAQDVGPGIEGVFWVSLLIPVAMVARGIFSFLNSYCMAWVSFRVLQDLRTQALPPSDFSIARILQQSQVGQTHFARAQ